MARTFHLDENPAFLADIASPMKKSEVMEKWGVSSSVVVDRRKRLKKGVTISSDPSVDGLSLGESSEITDENGEKKFNFIRHRPITLEDARDWIRTSGDDPDMFNISIRSIAYGGDKSSNRMTAWPKTGIAAAESLKLSELYKEAELDEQRHHRSYSDESEGDTRPVGTVIVIADWQVGKTGHRGGTPELLQRLTAARIGVERELLERRPERILLLDGGDGIENFESGGNPMFTNDLSLPDQLDCYATELFKFVRLASDFAPLEVGAVPSNHAAWRRGKMTLGRPADDFGLYVHRQVAKVAAAHGLDVAWNKPNDWDESLLVDFYGTPIGLVHGNQFGPGKAIDWWTQQAMGDQAVARADVLVTAHYHSWGSGVAGQNPFTKRERYWLGAPTLDSGSDWYRNVKGRDSLPGTMIFDVTEDGFDLGSLKII